MDNTIVYEFESSKYSESYESLKLNRKTIGIELKDSYFKQAVKNIKSIYEERQQLELFR